MSSNVIRVFGKTSFHSSKRDKDFFVLHCAMKKLNVEGLACEQKFVEKDIYDKCSVDTVYKIIYGCNDFGQAVVEDLQEVKSN